MNRLLPVSNVLRRSVSYTPSRLFTHNTKFVFVQPTREYATRRRPSRSTIKGSSSLTSRILNFVTGIVLLPVAMIMSLFIHTATFVATFALKRFIQKGVQNADQAMLKHILGKSRPLEQQITTLLRTPPHTEPHVTLLGLQVIDKHALLYEVLLKMTKKREEQTMSNTIRDYISKVKAMTKETPEFEFKVHVDTDIIDQRLEIDNGTKVTCLQTFGIYLTNLEEPYRYFIPLIVDVVATKRYINDDYKMDYIIIRSQETGEVEFEMREGFDEELFDEDGERKRVQILDAEVKEK